MANAFERGERKVIPAVLVYVKRGTQVLMLHRNGRADDYHSGKWNGLGGKLELGESPREAARRELLEESGLELAPEDFRPIGTLFFPNFKAHKSEDWWVTVFIAHLSLDAAPMLQAGDEGELHWIEEARLLSLPLWEGDRHFIPFVLNEKPFMGTLWYEGERVVRQEVLGV
jgi:8-oxo-dGTP diphosphatase